MSPLRDLHERVLQGRDGSPETQRQPADLSDTPLEIARLTARGAFEQAALNQCAVGTTDTREERGEGR